MGTSMGTEAALLQGSRPSKSMHGCCLWGWRPSLGDGQKRGSFLQPCFAIQEQALSPHPGKTS